MKRSSQPILLVEDDSVDVLTVKRAFSETNVPNEIACVLDGEQALEYLRDSSNPKPCLILLDLNMPKMDGLQLLEILKSDSNLRRIPVVVLTTSNDREDILRCFSFGAAGYIVKPVNYERFVEIVRAFEGYWSLSELPVVMS